HEHRDPAPMEADRYTGDRADGHGAAKHAQTFPHGLPPAARWRLCTHALMIAHTTVFEMTKTTKRNVKILLTRSCKRDTLYTHAPTMLSQCMISPRSSRSREIYARQILSRVRADPPPPSHRRSGSRRSAGRRRPAGERAAPAYAPVAEQPRGAPPAPPEEARAAGVDPAGADRSRGFPGPAICDERVCGQSGHR